MKLERFAAPSPAFERKQRRYKQAAREAQASTREKDGKKPFYLTLDREGVPYGSGRPAWMIEINKLAVALDPSCCYIKKQTYEDITIFKERLSQNFEYSGELNEAYLKSLMGRAVTRRRGELMKSIGRGEPQPNHIDSGVWERLLKLHASKQWEEKSQQGKHANSMRKTMNRTGNRGVHGVRENLRETLGRSPDPDEVYAEVHRDKGSGKTKYQKDTPTLNWAVNAGEESSEDADQEDSVEISSEPRSNDEGLGRISDFRSAHQVLMFD